MSPEEPCDPDVRPDGDPAEPAVPTDGVVAEESEVPSEDELQRVAVPGRVRRAPRYRAFVLTGLWLGALLGFLVVLLGPTEDRSGLGRGAVLVFVATAGAVVLGLIGALVAVLVDRASQRRADRSSATD